MMKRFLIVWLAALALSSWVNAQSATDPNEGTRLTQNSSSGTWIFSWYGHSGQTYFIQQSDDLIHWIYFPEIKSGTGALIQYGATSSADRFFLRLRYTDIATSDPANADFDQDGISNLMELQHGTDPLSASSNGSAVPDGWAASYGLEPTADATLDGSNNHLVYTYDNANRLTNMTSPGALAWSVQVDAEGNIQTVTQ